MRTFDDNQLMTMVQDGDLSKMGLLYKRHHLELFAYFFRLTGDKAGSEDMVHSLFYRLLKYRHTFRGESKFVYWMFSIAKNIWMDHYKKKKRDPITQADQLNKVNHHNSKERNAEEGIINSERINQLKTALLKLPEEKREAIILSKFQGMKYKDIAQISDCTESAVKSRIQRGLLELKMIMQQTEAR